MSAKIRFGELLSQIVPISGHDVDEILQEQVGTRKRFGAIALAWGLCQPEHVWSAWCAQLAHPDAGRVDLDEVGVDTQAVASLSPEVARRLRVMPVRMVGEQLVVATAESTPAAALAELPHLLDRPVLFVLAEGRQIDEMIEQNYPALPTAV